MGIDSTGHFIISTVVWIILGIVATTAVNVIYGAVTDTPIVIDLSISGGTGAGVGGKIGLSLVLDFKNESIEFYPHAGFFVGIKPNTFGFSYSTGIISNYSKTGDYAGPFVDMGGGYFFGIDHCYDPTKDYESATRASSFTFGNNIGIYYGNDYYGYW